MKIDPNLKEIYFKKCIICKKDSPNSYEHLFPESIGGRMAWKFLCKSCNDKLGSDLVSDVRKDPRIRLAIMNLKKDLPTLFKKIEERQLYESHDSKGNKIKKIFNDGRCKTPKQKIDGSLIGHANELFDDIVKMSKKDGLSEREIAKKLIDFKKIDDDEIIRISENIELIIIPENESYPNLTGKFISERFLIMMAYEFICLFLGEYCYDKRLDYIREYILENKKSDIIKIEGFLATKYRPVHKIYCERIEDKIIINILFFGYIFYKVIFNKFPYRFLDQVVIIENLLNNRTEFALPIEDGERGKFFYYGS